jgi:choline monooxygenase
MAYAVDPDIAVASTIDSAFYRDEAAYALARERIFARTWQWIGDLADVAEPCSLGPRELLPGLVDAPLLLARDGDGTLRCISNVCTHRGNILVKQSCRADQIRCGYHSRRFDLGGHMTLCRVRGAGTFLRRPNTGAHYALGVGTRSIRWPSPFLAT